MEELKGLVDKGGELDVSIKKASKELEDIKKRLRLAWAKGEIIGDVAEGTKYKVAAADHITTKVFKDRVVVAFLGLAASELHPGEKVEVDAGALRDLLRVADFKVSALKKVFTEDGLKRLTERDVKEHHTLKFAPLG